MVNDSDQPEFSSPSGYLTTDNIRRGISEGSSQPLGYKDAARYVEQVEDDVNVSGNVNISSVTGPFPENKVATFTALGVIRQAEPGVISGPSRLWGAPNRKFVKGCPNITGSSIVTITDISPVAGTLIGSGVTDDSDSHGRAVKLTTGAVAGNEAYATLQITDNRANQRRFKPYFYTKFRLGQLTNTRFWVGCFTSSSPSTSDTNTGINYIGVRFSSNASDTVFQLMASSGAGSSTATPFSMGAVAANTLYELEIWDDGVQLFGRVNLGNICTVTSTLPATSQTLAGTFSPAAIISTLNNSAQNFTIYDLYYEES